MILVIGATGTIGRHVVAGLIERGQHVRALTRDAAAAAAVLPAPGDLLEVVEGDLGDPATVARSLKDVDRAYLATQSPDQVALETAFIDAAATAGLAHLVKVSVIGAGPDNIVMGARGHGVIEDHLAASGVPATVLRPNWFAENFYGSVPTITGQGAIYGSAGQGKVAFVDSRDTAAAAIAVLTGDGHAGRDYVLTGPAALTFEQAAASLGAGIGRPVSYVDITDDQLHAAMIGAGAPDAVGDLVVQINQNARAGNLAQVTTHVTDLTGDPARSLEQFARDHAAAFTG